MDKLWYLIRNIDEIPSPSLAVYPSRIVENIRRMITIAGQPTHLRPHIKTHKMAEVIKLHLAWGVDQFKCATLAEAEMAAEAGARDMLLAYQPVGPNIQRLKKLIHKYPSTRFSTLVDQPHTISELSRAFASEPNPLPVFLDIDCGMGRTGVPPGEQAIELYQLISRSPGLQGAGLHAYDGHIHEPKLPVRERVCADAFQPVAKLKSDLQRLGMTVPMVVASGTPTFPIHARFPDRQCSPGTCVLWDFGYQNAFADLDFLIAALVLTRVISKPGHHRLCLDLGHKAIASEKPHPRVQFLNLPEAVAVMHSEEHLVIETARASEFQVGDVLYGVPLHVCPTVALHDTAVVVRDGMVDETWRIARGRAISV